MVKLLIVDDEQVEREGVQAVLIKAFPNLIIQEAVNGGHAVELAKEFQPDLVLMDIKMPGMNGLQAFEHIIADYPHIKFIMVTAFDTFDFIQQALRLGAKDYILKPSKASEIIETVGKILKQIEEEQKILMNSIIQKEKLQKTLALVETDIVTQLLFDHVHEVHLDMLVKLLDIKFLDEMFVIVIIVPNDTEHLYSVIKERVRQTGSGLVGPLNGNQLPIIVFRNPQQSYRTQAVLLAREILGIVKSELEKGWFIGIGSVCHSLEEVRQSYMDSLLATMDTSLPVKYRFYSDIPKLSDTYIGEIFSQLTKEIFEQVRIGEWEQVQTKIIELIKNFEIKGLNLLETQQRVLEVLWVISRSLNEMGIETVTPLFAFYVQDYRQLRSETRYLIERMRETYDMYFEGKESDTIQQLKQYIIEHSNKDISLEALSDRVGLSPIYISRIFKEKLGINYIDFLTECRIEKAKKLMVDPDLSIKEISYEVGYHEPNYFSKVFKKMCSVSPKEFRNSLFKLKAE